MLARLYLLLGTGLLGLYTTASFLGWELGGYARETAQQSTARHQADRCPPAWWRAPVGLGVRVPRGEVMDWNKLAGQLVTMVVAVGVGLTFFAAAFYVISRVAPFSVRKEIEEDQNTALGIIVGAVILGIAVIIAAAIHGT